MKGALLIHLVYITKDGERKFGYDCVMSATELAAESTAHRSLISARFEQAEEEMRRVTEDWTK